VAATLKEKVSEEPLMVATTNVHMEAAEKGKTRLEKPNLHKETYAQVASGAAKMGKVWGEAREKDRLELEANKEKYAQAISGLPTNAKFKFVRPEVMKGKAKEAMLLAERKKQEQEAAAGQRVLKIRPVTRRVSFQLYQLRETLRMKRGPIKRKNSMPLLNMLSWSIKKR
jgi:hypothetical protein